MQLPERIMTRWVRCSRVASRHLAIDESGVSLGKTLLAPFVNGRLQVDAESVIAMLSAAYNRKVPDSIIDSFRHAERCFKRGDKALANMHLALTGLHAVDLDMAQRLFVADWAMENGVSARRLYKFVGLSG